MIETFQKIFDFIRSKEQIDTQNYKSLFKDKMKYFAMNKIHITPKIHKILFHGPRVIEFLQNLGASGPGVFLKKRLKLQLEK